MRLPCSPHRKVLTFLPESKMLITYQDAFLCQLTVFSAFISKIQQGEETMGIGKFAVNMAKRKAKKTGLFAVLTGGAVLVATGNPVLAMGAAKAVATSMLLNPIPDIDDITDTCCDAVDSLSDVVESVPDVIDSTTSVSDISCDTQFDALATTGGIENEHILAQESNGKDVSFGAGYGPEHWQYDENFHKERMEWAIQRAKDYPEDAASYLSLAKDHKADMESAKAAAKEALEALNKK